MAATKFSAPAPASWHIQRPRLHAALDAGARVPLTVVVGAPGAGKSVVLGSWLHDRPELASIWLSCDERDADPVTFWSALTAALARRWTDHWLDATDADLVQPRDGSAKYDFKYSACRRTRRRLPRRPSLHMPSETTKARRPPAASRRSSSAAYCPLPVTVQRA